MSLIRKLSNQRIGMRKGLSLQRSNVIRYVAGHPGKTSGEIAKALGMRSQNVGQILHKCYEVRGHEGKWTLRHG